jgi:RNA polymerase sigma factor (sigma-70 family)
MATGQLDSVVRHLRHLAGGLPAESDQQLLQRFATSRDEEAFALLLRRHGPLVLGVCRRVLGDGPDAEDAFQATFLVLAHKAATVKARRGVGSWLHGVAWRISQKARVAAARRRKHEQKVGIRRPAAGDVEAAWQTVGAVLDEELQRLPARYRLPLVLCYWEDRTHQAAARELGIPVGTLSWRLGRARALLRQRLLRRGITLPGTLLAVLLAGSAASAIPPALAAKTVATALAFVRDSAVAGAAAGLARSVLNAMLVARLRTAFVLLLTLAVLAAGAGFLTRSVEARAPLEAEPADVVPDTSQRTDRLGDLLPADVLVRLGTVRFRHGDLIKAAAYSPDGTLLATAGQDGAVRLWDPATGKELAEFRDPDLGDIRCISFSADGKMLASAHRYGNLIHVWDVTTRKQLRAFGRAVDVVAFSPDGNLLATAGIGSGRDELCHWDVATGQMVLAGDTQEEMHKLAFSPDGKLLATVDSKGSAQVWDATTCRELRPLVGHGGPVETLAFAPDGKLLATASRDKTVRLWDPATGKEVRRLPEHGGAVAALAFSRDGKTLASRTKEGDVHVWDNASAKEVNRFRAAVDGEAGMTLSPDGKTVATWGDGCLLRLWDARTGKERPPSDGHEGTVRGVAYSPDGTLLATGSYDGTIRLWDPKSGREVRRVERARGSVNSLAFGAGGKLLATATWEGAVQVWDARTGRELPPPDGQERAGRCVALSPDGKLLASGSEDGMVRVWETQSGQMRFANPGPPGAVVNQVVFSPDGKTLVSTAQPKVFRNAGEVPLHFWDVSTGQEQSRLEGRAGGVVTVAFSPDGERLATAGDDCIVRLLDLRTNKELWQFPGFRGTPVSVAFSPDGKYLATGGDQLRTIRIWEVLTGKAAQELNGHRGWVDVVAFAPDGRTLASGSCDGTALVWDLTRSVQAGGRELRDRDSFWTDLAKDEADPAYRAMWALTATPAETIAFLRQRLVPGAQDPSRQDRITRLIADLDADDFVARERATKELQQLAEEAEPALRQLLAGKPSAETRKRAEQLLEQRAEQGPSADVLRVVRAVTVLEQIGTPEARELLRAYSAGAGGARLTREARAALERLDHNRGRN